MANEYVGPDADGVPIHAQDTVLWDGLTYTVVPFYDTTGTSFELVPYNHWDGPRPNAFVEQVGSSNLRKARKTGRRRANRTSQLLDDGTTASCPRCESDNIDPLDGGQGGYICYDCNWQGPRNELVKDSRRTAGYVIERDEMEAGFDNEWVQGPSRYTNDPAEALIFPTRGEATQFMRDEDLDEEGGWKIQPDSKLPHGGVTIEDPGAGSFARKRNKQARERLSRRAMLRKRAVLDHLEVGASYAVTFTCNCGLDHSEMQDTLTIQSVDYGSDPRATVFSAHDDTDFEVYSFNNDDKYGDYWACALPGEPVSTLAGMESVEDIVPGASVLTHLGRYRPVLEAQSRPYVGQAVELKPHYGLPLRYTFGHQVLTRRGWVAIESVTTADQVFVPVDRSCEDIRTVSVWDALDSQDWQTFDPADDKWGRSTPGRSGEDERRRRIRRLESRGVAPGTILGRTGRVGGRYSIFNAEHEITDDFLRLCGLYLAEGSKVDGACWSYGSHETDLTEETVSLIKRVFGLQASVVPLPKHSVNVIAYNLALGSWFKALFGGDAKSKHMPPWMVNLPPNRAAVVLGGLFEGDGHCANEDGPTHRKAYSLRTSSPRLREQTARLVRRAGFVSVTYEAHAVRDGTECVWWSVSPTMAEVTDFGRYLGWSEERVMRSLGSAAISDPRYADRVPTGYWVKVHRSRVFDYDGPVYDINVAQDHSFVSSVAVHNCGTDADPIIFDRKTSSSTKTAGDYKCARCSKPATHFAYEEGSRASGMHLCGEHAADSAVVGDRKVEKNSEGARRSAKQCDVCESTEGVKHNKQTGANLCSTCVYDLENSHASRVAADEDEVEFSGKTTTCSQCGESVELLAEELVDGKAPASYVCAECDDLEKSSTRFTATLSTITVGGVTYDWNYEYDDFYAQVEGEDGLVVVLLDYDTGEVVDSLGGITVGSLQISDHGNVNVSPEDEEYLKQRAIELAEDQGTTASRRMAAECSEPDGNEKVDGHTAHDVMLFETGQCPRCGEETKESRKVTAECSEPDGNEEVDGRTAHDVMIDETGQCPYCGSNGEKMTPIDFSGPASFD
jgi:hypothetical protein